MTVTVAAFDRRRLLGCLGLLGATLSGCSGLPSARDRRGTAGRRPPAPGPLSRLSEDQAREVTFLALSLVDTPYRWGGNTPQSGFDCSGLIVYVFRESAGHPLPRTVKEIARVGQSVRIDALRTGDLVFFDAPRRLSHAGIYVGSGRFVHAPSSGGLVRLDGVFENYWRPRLSRIRRI